MIVNLLGVPSNITSGDRKIGRSCDESRSVVSLYFFSSTEPQTFHHNIRKDIRFSSKSVGVRSSLGFYYSRGYYYARTTTKKTQTLNYGFFST